MRDGRRRRTARNQNRNENDHGGRAKAREIEGPKAIHLGLLEDRIVAGTLPLSRNYMSSFWRIQVIPEFPRLLTLSRCIMARTTKPAANNAPRSMANSLDP